MSQLSGPQQAYLWQELIEQLESEPSGRLASDVDVEVADGVGHLGWCSVGKVEER